MHEDPEESPLQAKAVAEKAVALAETALGPDPPGTAASLNNLAALLLAMGDLQAARPLFERAWKINRDAMHTLLAVQSPQERVAMLQERALQLAYYLSAFASESRKT
ncbi:MAG: tetratricopeptide repeat protein [Planctomycetes bacterium]|nr:tetratricopeptide repeat protein [Planctomycetota bacterium]